MFYFKARTNAVLIFHESPIYIDCPLCGCFNTAHVICLSRRLASPGTLCDVVYTVPICIDCSGGVRPSVSSGILRLVKSM